MESFRGHSFHTSRWDYDYTGEDLSGLADKVVGIIGTGATAVQAVPGLGEAARELYVFQRTPSSIDIRDDHPTDPNWARKLKPGWQTERRNMMRKIMDPQLTEEQKVQRAALPREEIIRRQENANIDYMLRIHQRIDEIVKDKATAEALKPWYMFMCKRPCFHNDYLPTFNRPNVHLVDTHGKGISEITEKGVVFEGKQYALDLLIYATGFEVQKTGIYNRITGVGGLDLTDKYSSGIRTLFGLHTQGYPNLFIMGGYQSSFQFNLTDILNTEGDHIAACIDHVRRNGYRSIDPTPEAEEWWVQEVIKHRGQDQPQPGLYARLLQLRGRVQPPPGRELQRWFPPLCDFYAGRPAEDGRALRLHPAGVNALRPIHLEVVADSRTDMQDKFYWLSPFFPGRRAVPTQPVCETSKVTPSGPLYLTSALPWWPLPRPRAWLMSVRGVAPAPASFCAISSKFSTSNPMW